LLVSSVSPAESMRVYGYIASAASFP